ncbi:MAG TPA: glycosyltransferase [Solirubrobacteraceae bacterium]|nr:glycosyltransferase [Solirubrobacteraceae bacterium]
MAHAALLRHTQPLPKLRTGPRHGVSPVIYFPTPDYNVPAGGIRVVYRHVDLLNSAGIPAAVLHRRPGFRCTWFENHTTVANSRDTVIGPQDLVVVGELSAGLLDTLPPSQRFAVFNQNPHLTWRQASEELVGRYATSPALAAIMTVSDHSAEMLRYLAPTAQILRFHNSIDPRIFHPGHEERGRTIAYMPRRGLDEARQVFGLLRARGTLDGWRVLELEGVTEREVADRLRSTAVFLSFAFQEGFGLPAAEAMACGSYVIGFHGFSGREFFRPEFSDPIAPGDVVVMAQTVERVLQRETATPGWCAARGAQAAAFVAVEYSPAREQQDVIRNYTALATSAGVPRTPEHAPVTREVSELNQRAVGSR